MNAVSAGLRLCTISMTYHDNAGQWTEHFSVYALVEHHWLHRMHVLPLIGGETHHSYFISHHFPSVMPPGGGLESRLQGRILKPTMMVWHRRKD